MIDWRAESIKVAGERFKRQTGTPRFFCAELDITIAQSFTYDHLVNIGDEGAYFKGQWSLKTIERIVKDRCEEVEWQKILTAISSGKPTIKIGKRDFTRLSDVTVGNSKVIIAITPRMRLLTIYRSSQEQPNQFELVSTAYSTDVLYRSIF